MKKTTILIAAAILGLSGCGASTGVSGAQSADSAATSAPTAATDDSTAEPAAEEESTDGSDGTVKFGKTFTWDDGIAITVTAPKKFKASETSAGAEGKGTSVVMQVTVKNGSKKAFDPTLVYATAQSNEAEASQIFDSAQKLEGSPSTKVLAGKTVKFKMGFHVLNAKDITLEISPGFEYDSVIFTS